MLSKTKFTIYKQENFKKSLRQTQCPSANVKTKGKMGQNDEIVQYIILLAFDPKIVVS